MLPVWKLLVVLISLICQIWSAQASDALTTAILASDIARRNGQLQSRIRTLNTNAWSYHYRIDGLKRLVHAQNDVIRALRQQVQQKDELRKQLTAKQYENDALQRMLNHTQYQIITLQEQLDIQSIMAKIH